MATTKKTAKASKSGDPMRNAFKDVAVSASGKLTKMFASPLPMEVWTKIDAIRAAALAGKVTGKPARLTNAGVIILAVEMLFKRYCKKASPKKAKPATAKKTSA